MHTPSSPNTATTRTVLIGGANGFIGSQIARQLTQAGWQVRAASRSSQPPLDYVQAHSPEHWLPLLEGVDAVVNAVGVLRESKARPMRFVHEATPIALFDACAQAGVRRVVQVSALGIANGTTPYARTKRAADAHLLHLNAQGRLDGVVLRPSLVFGAAGDSTQLFMNLARLPVVLLPGPVISARVQPVAVWELAEAAARLIDDPAHQRTTGLLEIAGPSSLTMADYIASLRSQNGKRPAKVLALPGLITQLSARAGDALPFSPWCSESLAMLATDNVADPAALAQLLGRRACAPQDFLRVQAERNPTHGSAP